MKESDFLAHAGLIEYADSVKRGSTFHKKGATFHQKANKSRVKLQTDKDGKGLALVALVLLLVVIPLIVWFS